MEILSDLIMDAPFDLIEHLCTRLEYPRGKKSHTAGKTTSQGTKTGAATLEDITKIRAWLTQLRDFRKKQGVRV